MQKTDLLLSQFLLFLTVLVLSMIGAPHLADSMVEQKVIKKSKLWQSKIIELLDNGTFTFTMGEVTADDRTSLNVFIRISESYRYVLFKSDGTMYFSSKASKIGKRETRDYFFNTVAKGSLFVKRALKKSSEIDDLVPGSVSEPRKIIEIYLPVMRGNEFVGAIEHYFDATPDIESLTDTIRLIVVVLSVIALIFGATVVGQVMLHSRGQSKLLQELHQAEVKHLAEASNRNEESIILSELNDWLQSSQSLDELYDMVRAFLTKLLPGCPGSIYIYSNSRDILEGACSWNNGDLAENMQADDCWGLRRGRIYSFGAHKVDFVCKHKPQDTEQAYCCIPIVAHGETVGLLHIELPREDQQNGISWDGYKRVAAVAAEQISLAIANVKLRDQLRDQSIRDPLTGLFNRRYLMEGLRREIARCIRRKEKLALLSFDVDHFKRFNDNHGHDAGDTVLRFVGETILNEFRGEDIACRYGGEEFVVVMSGADLVAAKDRANKLREAIERNTVQYGGTTLPSVTISIGVAIAPDCGTSPQDLINSGDRALYKAKAQGRNCVVIAEEIAGSEAEKEVAPIQLEVVPNSSEYDEATQTKQA